MIFYADLHVHSRYSRATSRDADLEHLALWARRKGLTVIGTGDFTHPAWFEEIRDKLVPAEPGLFRLRPDLEAAIDRQLPAVCHGPVRFLLEVEISTIYKKGEKTRKVHHLIYASNLETAGRLREKLGTIGNLAADGRPILGLDSRHLLEITLESGPDAYLIPAHVWTPWFAVLGSKSGFDTVEECYGDLTPHIFAVETGLSSDPPMNARVSQLDRFTLVSNSDAHSPPMLGREASVFSTDLDYFAIRRALETGEGFAGTVEFFPEEGKYHLDGHRACNVRLDPTETRRLEGRCPACGKPLTVGVLHRVEELADRTDPAGRAQTPAFRSLVPLPEIVAEIRGTGPKTRGVEDAVHQLTGKLGPEMAILETLPLEEVARAGDPLLVEALTRLRAGQVHRESGYDGEYGVIRLFAPGEIHGRAVVAPLWGADAGLKAAGGPESRLRRDPHPPAPSPTRTPARPGEGEIPGSNPILDPEQRAATEALDGPLLIVAGPGTGKTRTLIHRLVRILERRASPEQCLAVTFSRRAAVEMRERLAALLPLAAGRVLVTTFHGLGLTLLREQAEAAGLPPDFRVALPSERAEIAGALFGLTAQKAERLLEKIATLRRLRADLGDDPLAEDDLPSGLTSQAAAYEEALASRGLVDFDALLLKPLALFAARPDLAARYRDRFRWISIDEYQDIDPLQYALVRHLAPPGANLCAIGDPDQSIYRFRGADVGFFLRFRQDYPGARLVQLTRNYRASKVLVEAARQAIRPGSLVPNRQMVAVRQGNPPRVVVQAAASERAEAELVVHTLEGLLGGTSAFSFDSGRVATATWANDELSFDDVAILYRTEAQTPVLIEALGRAGIPFQKRSHRPLTEQPGVLALLAFLRKEPPAGKPVAVEARLDRAVVELTGNRTGPAATGLLAAAELLRPLATRAGDDLERFLTEATLGGEVDTWDPRAERVSLLTLHASKGLEFRVVFLVGCEEGLLPLTWGDDPDEADLAEERRLFFVGLTRACARLYLFHRKKPSPFLAAIDEALLERRREPEPGPRKPEQLRLV